MKSGIYKIINTKTNQFYIGSAVTLNYRKNTHFSKLRCKMHRNKHLQSSFNKHGEINFKFEVVAKCPKEYLIKLEQWFIDNLKPHYNVCKIAGSTLGIKQPNKFSTETRELLSFLKTGKKRGQYNTGKTQVAENYKIFVKCGEEITMYNSYQECCVALKIPNTTLINGLLRKNKVYNKYLFSYTNEFEDNSKYRSNPHSS